MWRLNFFISLHLGYIRVINCLDIAKLFSLKTESMFLSSISVQSFQAFILFFLLSYVFKLLSYLIICPFPQLTTVLGYILFYHILN